MKLNAGQRSTSARVQCGRCIFCSRSVRGYPTSDRNPPLERTTNMLRTIAAALLAASVISAPAFAAGEGAARAVAQSPKTTTKSVLIVKKVTKRKKTAYRRHHRHYAHRKHIKQMTDAKATHNAVKVTKGQSTKPAGTSETKPAPAPKS